MSAYQQVAQSEWLTLALAVLNVAQVVWLADIAARARRVRRGDEGNGRRRGPSRRPPT